MNKFILTIAVVTGLFVGVVPVTHARTLEIGLSPFVEKEKAKTQVKQVLEFLTTIIEPGDTARIYDAFNLSTIGTFSVPDKPTYRHPKAKIGANRKAVGALLKFARASRVSNGSKEPSVTGAIKLPQFLRFVGNNHPPKEKTDLILLGSPLYDSPSEKRFSMAEGHVPSDGYISRSRKDSPFGTKGDETLLKNFRVHFGFPGQGWKKNDQHAHYVKRFTVLFVERQAGELVTFTHDLETLFQRVKGGAKTPDHGFVLEDTNKLEMNLFDYNKVSRKQVSIYERKTTKAPVSRDVIARAEKVQIGLSWDAPCDIDIYARPGKSGETLYFGKNVSSFGVFHKDFMSSPRLSQAYETISFYKPIHLKELFLAINFYGGHVSKPIQLELRIAIGSKTYKKHYVIRATKGNNGAGKRRTLSSGQPANDNWLVIDPMEVVRVDGRDRS